MTLQFFTKGLDFTTIFQASGSQHNQLVDAAHTAADKGIVLVSTDTAVGVADEPNVADVPEFGKHLWLRKPFDNTYAPALYCYFNGVWVSLIVDISAITALATAANATADAALVVANSTNANLAAVSTVSNQAALDAAAAKVTAANAVSTAGNASASAIAAQATANTALGLGLKRFQSTAKTLTILAVDSLEEEHGFVNTPDIVRAVLVCKIADSGYAANDEIGPESVAMTNIYPPIMYCGANLTKVFATVLASNTGGTDPQFLLRHKTTGALVSAVRTNWAMRIYAYSRS